MRTPTVAPTTTAPRARRPAAPWEGCPTSTLAPPTATAHTKATRLPVPTTCAARARWRTKMPAPHRRRRARRRNRPPRPERRHHHDGQGDRYAPAAGDDGLPRLGGRRGSGVAGGGLLVVSAFACSWETRYHGRCAAARHGAGRASIRCLAVRCSPRRAPPFACGLCRRHSAAATAASECAASVCMAASAILANLPFPRPVFGYHTNGRESRFEEAAR